MGSILAESPQAAPEAHFFVTLFLVISLMLRAVSHLSLPWIHPKILLPKVKPSRRAMLSLRRSGGESKVRV